jgi:hypothetical protein
MKHQAESCPRQHFNFKKEIIKRYIFCAHFYYIEINIYTVYIYLVIRKTKTVLRKIISLGFWGGGGYLVLTYVKYMLLISFCKKLGT